MAFGPAAAGGAPPGPPGLAGEAGDEAGAGVLVVLEERDSRGLRRVGGKGPAPHREGVGGCRAPGLGAEVPPCPASGEPVEAARPARALGWAPPSLATLAEPPHFPSRHAPTGLPKKPASLRPRRLERAMSRGPRANKTRRDGPAPRAATGFPGRKRPCPTPRRDASKQRTGESDRRPGLLGVAPATSPVALAGDPKHDGIQAEHPAGARPRPREQDVAAWVVPQGGLAAGTKRPARQGPPEGRPVRKVVPPDAG